MTSRVSFYKVLLQDLRHRLWMIVLSCLGSFMAMPVFYLLESKNWNNNIARWSVEIYGDLDVYKRECMELFYCRYLPIAAGVILVVGALIVGIWGFRHVFSKKMVDQYHSIPIKRKDLFFANYLNGFLIWFVPMFIGGLSCAVLSGFFMGNFVDWAVYVLKPLFVTMCNLVIAFLLVYHMTIVAVMLSGNILNTIVNGTIISFAVLAIYAMIEVFCDIYFETYYSFFGENIKNIMWVSPIASAIYQLYMHVMEEMYVFPVVMNIIMIIGMFAVGFVVYLRRPSELAEQGMKIKPAQVVFKTVTTILAGLAGWCIFYLLTSSLSWQIFGTVLAGVLCYGVLDIVFNMDFKAFFAHKIQLGITVLASILIGCLFYFDWIEYDSYMPEKDDIAEMGIFVQGLGISNTTNAYDGVLSIENRIKRMSYKDQDVIYELLAELTDRESQYPDNGSSSMVYVRVTEKNGKTYYRHYRLWESDEELILPILRDDSYIRTNVMIPQVIIDDVRVDINYYNVQLQKFNNEWKLYDVAFIKELMTAYNEDMLENPDLYIYQNDEVMANLYYNGGSQYIYLRPDLYESMEHVREVLKKYDYEEVMERITADEVASISLNAYVSKYEETTLEEVFGLVEPEEDKKGESANLNAESAEVVTIPQIEYTTEDYYKQTIAADYDHYFYSAVITDKKDIEELLEVITYDVPNYRTLFREDYSNADIMLTLKNEETYYVQIKDGKLPERFLAYFECLNNE